MPRLDEIEKWLDEVEMDLIMDEAMKRHDLRCTAHMREAVHAFVEKYYWRWRERHL
jgi:hypothetical protein